MKATVITALIATLVGVGLGVALGYVEARPWTWKPGQPGIPKPAEGRPGDAEAAMPAPGLVVDDQVFEFEKMEIGTTQRHAFKLTNQGDQPHEITVASITCQCTGLRIAGVDAEPSDSRTVAPGETIDLELEWVAKPPPRPFRHGAALTTSDPRQRRLEIEVEGEIVASTTLNPQQIYFGSVPVGESKSAEVTVTSFSDPEVRILSHEVVGSELAGQIDVDVEPLTTDQLAANTQGGAKIVATVGPQKTLGPFAGRLKVTTNLERAAELSIPFSGNVIGDISIYGPGWLARTGLLKLGAFSSSEGKTVQLNVAVRGEHAAETEIKVASIDPPQLRATVGKRRMINEHLAHVELIVEAPRGIRPLVRMEPPPGAEPVVRTTKQSRGEGSIVLSTTHPETPEVKLRLSLTVLP